MEIVKIVNSKYMLLSVIQKSPWCFILPREKEKAEKEKEKNKKGQREREKKKQNVGKREKLF